MTSIGDGEAGEFEMSKAAVRPYLVSKDAEGRFRVTIRRTRFNSQNYPLVTATLIEESFATATAARNYLRAEYDVVATDIATS
ncbi:MAG: hypothetical protein AB7L36_02225 [Sphingomonadaceae bacterium]